MAFTDEQLKGMTSSETNEWATPQWLFDQLHEEFRFTLDVAATEDNAKCERYYTELTDGLAQPWAPETCWMNPPYGRGIGTWVKKAWEESCKGATVVCLVPSRTDTEWWHTFCMRANEIRFVRGRVKFVGEQDNSAPFPSALVVFRPVPKATVLRQHKGNLTLLGDDV